MGEQGDTGTDDDEDTGPAGAGLRSLRELAEETLTLVQRQAVAISGFTDRIVPIEATHNQILSDHERHGEAISGLHTRTAALEACPHHHFPFRISKLRLVVATFVLMLVSSLAAAGIVVHH